MSAGIGPPLGGLVLVGHPETDANGLVTSEGRV